VLPQLMFPVFDVTVPVPLPAFVTVRAKVVLELLNVAVTERAAVIETVQLVDVPLQEPPPPPNVEPLAAAAMSVTEVPLLKFALQVLPQFVSGPAILHLNSGGQGSVTIYLADDSGVRGDSCPTSAADHVAPLLVMKNADHVSDVPIPGGKRVCAVFEGADDLSLSWLAEVFPKSKAAEGAAPAVARGEALHGVVLARR